MKILKRVCEQYPFKLYCYCMMGNHLHLQIATIEDEIWKIMKNVNWKYTMYYNKKYDKVGHLFQGRYYSDIISSDSHLLQTSKYIHLNPVKAGIVKKPIQYPWSSYGIFMGVIKNNLVAEDNILNIFQDSNKNVNRELYRIYVESHD